MAKILFFDVETTGLDHKIHGIHQLAGMLEIDGEIVETFNFKIRLASHLKVEPDALKISGITPEDIQSYPDEQSVYADFISLLRRNIDKYDRFDKAFLAGWNNASFDNHFLRAFFERNNDKFFGSWFWSNSIDVMVLATEFSLAWRYKMENFKLMTVANELIGKVDTSRLHDATYDIELTRNIYQILKTQVKWNKQ